MRLPSKVTPYQKSILYKFPMLLGPLSQKDYSPLELYALVKNKMNTIGEFMTVIECLYLLGRIEWKDQEGVLHYVKGT